MFIVYMIQATRVQWQKVFYIALAIYAFGALFYVIFGSGSQQPWAQSKSDENNGLLFDKSNQEDPDESTRLIISDDVQS